MKKFVEYCKAIWSLAFGLMIWIGAVMIAVPNYQKNLPFSSAQSVDQSDALVTLSLDAGTAPQMFSWTVVRYNLEIANFAIQWMGEDYPDAEIHIILTDGLEYESLSQDRFVINSTPTQVWNTFVFSYLDPLPSGETHLFSFDVRAIDIWTQVVSVEIIHPAWANESNPYVWWCENSSNNVACSTLNIEENLEPTCNPVLWSISLYEDGELIDNSFRNIPACEVGEYGDPVPNPWDLISTDTEFTFACVLTGKTPVLCSVARRFCGDTAVDSDQGEACDTNDVDGLTCDTTTCQIIWCSNPLAYNHDLSATQDNGECRAMGDGILDFSDGEVCDDGNTESWDGCSTVWTLESGYTCAILWVLCQDINECEQSQVCGWNSICENTPWLYNCSCESGYESPDGANCSDIDECVVWTDTCSDNAMCSNTQGGFSCACEAWYEWDGEICSDIDECATWADQCDDSWVCSNDVWWYSCSCTPWYYNQINSQWSQLVNTCLEIDECTGQVSDWNWWYQTIQDSASLSQWDNCAALWWICSNELWGNPWHSCDCPTGYQPDGQWVCQVVYGDGIVIDSVELCDTGSVWVDDGCDDLGQFDIPTCTLTASSSTWSIETLIQVDLSNSIAPRATAVLVERWDGTLIESPSLTETTTYSVWQQYTVTATIESNLDSTVLGTCEAVVAIDTVCWNAVLETWEECDIWNQNWVACDVWFWESCGYCGSSCTQEILVNDSVNKIIEPSYSISYSESRATLEWEEEWVVEFFRVNYWTSIDNLEFTLTTDNNEAIIAIVDSEQPYYYQIIPLNESGEVIWIASQILEVPPIQDIQPVCGNTIYEEDTEECDEWANNGRVCSGAQWTTCEYCGSSCEIQEYDVPLSLRSGSSSSVSVSVKSTSTWIQTEKTHNSAWEEENTTSDDVSKDDDDTDFVESIVDSLVSDWTSPTVWAWEWDWVKNTTITALSLDEIFMQPVSEITPESLSEILSAIRTSTKDEIRNALQRYLDIK